MEDLDALKEAMRRDPAIDVREARAAKTRAAALSPLRILVQIAFVPVTTVVLTLSIYTVAGPYDETDTLRHFIAMAGCDTAAHIGMVNVAEGQPGYHAANDDNGNGIACEDPQLASVVPATTSPDIVPMDGPLIGAKFVRPQ